ncbi:MAG: MOSC domain-containing protein [Bryobacteraceae bacterium]
MTVGKVESLWRYPVKSMRGEQMDEVFLGFSGVYGDRIYAFRSSAAIPGFPYFTAREQEQMLLYRPHYRHPASSVKPPNLQHAEALGCGVTPLYADPAELIVDVETPTGEILAIDHPQLIRVLREGVRDRHELTLLRSDRAMTDCRPISIFSLQTVRQLSHEVGLEIDKRQFRANVYIELDSGTAFGEDKFVGQSLRIGPKVVVVVTDRDARCKMITLHPDTAAANPDVMRRVAGEHEGKVGVYGVVLVEGMIRAGDEITLVNRT